MSHSLLVTAFGLIFGFPVAGPASGETPDFDLEIAPLLATHCLECHRGDNTKGKLDLSTRAGALKGGKSGPALVAKLPETSLLLERVTADEMPPKQPLGAKEKDLLKAWVKAGAPWGPTPDRPIDPFRYTTSGRAGYDWWSLKPVQAHGVPKDWNGNPVDFFIRKKLAEAGLKPNPEADRRILLRRLSLDLTGLAPTANDYKTFLNDTAPQAYERQVDRLLASPHYGERWARHWLDVARYGETDGFERNPKRPNAWPYRDWVIRALNEDMPFDRFARLQLAGDALEPDNPDAVKATGFLVGGVYNTVLGNDQMRRANRQDELEDLIGTVGQSFLGLTVNCARCHDHKFDPIGTDDYYRMAASLAGVNHGERKLPDPGLVNRIARLEEAKQKTDGELENLEGPVRQALLQERRKGPDGPAAPRPMISWDFSKGLKDTENGLVLKPEGPVRQTPDGVRLADNGYLKSEPIRTTLREKTLETWVLVDPGTQQGGAPVSLFKPGDATFDAIVYAELEKNRWMAGSDFFRRTRSFQSPDTNSPALDRWVHVAITYHADGKITGYRDGMPYGTAYQSAGLFPFEAGQSQILVGCRLEPAGGNKMFTGTVGRVRIYDRALSADEVKRSFDQGDTWPSRQEVIARLSPPQKTEHAALTAKLDQLNQDLVKARAVQGARVYAVVGGNPEVTRVLARGDYTKPGKVVGPGGVRSAGLPAGEFGLKPDASDRERRIRLAEWISSRDNPLFARVAVNRLWLHHFGAGLVETPSDFGFNGGNPSHPELLDWLATEFLRQNHSLKAMHKLMVTSATYRQSSAPVAESLAKDADNRLLWRMRKRRLEGEILRDLMLQAAGTLNLEIGGPGFSDYRVIDTGNGTTYYEPFDSDAPELQRRSIYRFTPRGGETSMLDLFDCPDCATASPKRSSTTTPLQALSLWNGAMALRLAGNLARLIEKQHAGIPNQIDAAYQMTLGRPPTELERQKAGELAKKHGLRAVCRVLFNSNEFLTVE